MLDEGTAKEIASLFNTIRVGDIMLTEHAYDGKKPDRELFNLWFERVKGAENSLFNKYGISLPGSDGWTRGE